MISIALATYNGEKYLREQLDSIFSQTYKDIEVVACDDGSSDGTVYILKDYERKHGLRLYVNEKNLGYIKNFEKAVLLCEGEYIALSDQDDVWESQKLDKLVKGIRNNLLIFSDASLITGDGKEITRSAFKYVRVNPMRALSMQYMAFRNYVTGCTILFQCELIKKAVPFNSNVSHDYWLAMFALNENRLIYLPDQLVKYRQHLANRIGIHPVTLSNTVSRIIRIRGDLVDTMLSQKELASCEKFRNDFKQTLRRAVVIYETITSKNTHFIIKFFYLLRYFKYLSGKSIVNCIILRIVQRSIITRSNYPNF